MSNDIKKIKSGLVAVPAIIVPILASYNQGSKDLVGLHAGKKFDQWIFIFAPPHKIS